MDGKGGVEHGKRGPSVEVSGTMKMRKLCVLCDSGTPETRTTRKIQRLTRGQKRTGRRRTVRVEFFTWKERS